MIMITKLINKYNASVPRYTSYPTAPHFHGDINGDIYADWLKNLDNDEELSLYFHVPYCDTLCWFCGCFTKITAQYGPVSDYLDSMIKEIDLVASALDKDKTGKKRPVKHIHWGGGSPTILNADDISRLVNHVAEKFNLLDNAEIAVEIDPRGFGNDKVLALAAAGVNRASIGVQDFNIKVQKAINRIQPYGETKQVVDNLRAAGIHDINMDIMYGLPFQTSDHIRNTIEKIISLDPSRLALFGYAHVPWMKTHQKLIKDDTLPDADLRLKHMTLASDLLVDAGYVAIGLDHFSKPEDPLAIAKIDDKLHRNFQGYTTDTAETLIGFGASAIGVSEKGYIQNIAPINEYRRQIGAGKLPIAKGIEFNIDDKMRGDLIKSLMCKKSTDIDKILAKYDMPLDYLDDEFIGLTDLVNDKIISLDGHIITLSDDGRHLVRVVAARFDAYLANGRGRHSQAV